MQSDQRHLTAASAAILSLTVVVCVTGPATAAAVPTPAQVTRASSEARRVPGDQREAMVALLGRLTEAARDLCRPTTPKQSGAASPGPSRPLTKTTVRRGVDIERPARVRRPAVRLALLNLPPPAHL